MRKVEAEALLGKKVRAWTAANGEYVGTLVKVAGSPWRGTVEISGVLKPAQHFERGAVVRRGFRVGDLIEVGHTSVRPTEAVGHSTYLAALEEELGDYRQILQRGPGSKDVWWVEGGIRALTAVIEAERHRETTGEWRVLVRRA